MQCEALEYAVKSLIQMCIYYLWNEVLALAKSSIKLVVLSYCFFFSSLVFIKMLSFLNLALLWKIDSPEGGCGEMGKNRKASLSDPVVVYNCRQLTFQICAWALLETGQLWHMLLSCVQARARATFCNSSPLISTKRSLSGTLSVLFNNLPGKLRHLLSQWFRPPPQNADCLS